MLWLLTASQPASPTIPPHSLWSRHIDLLGVLGLSKLVHATGPLHLHPLCLDCTVPPVSKTFSLTLFRSLFQSYLIWEPFPDSLLSKWSTQALPLRPHTGLFQPSPCLILLHRAYFHVKWDHVLICLVSVSIAHSIVSWTVGAFSCSPLSPKGLAWCLAHSWYSIKICWMTEEMNIHWAWMERTYSWDSSHGECLWNESMWVCCSCFFDCQLLEGRPIACSSCYFS